jgi:hypothetical protein
MGAMSKLKSTVTGDTISDVDGKVVFPPITFSLSVFSRALEYNKSR